MCSQAELVQNVEDVAVLERLHVPARKLHVLGNGVDLVRFQPRPAEASTVRQTLGVRDDQVVAGVVGRLVWEKGFAELFEAARHCVTPGPRSSWSSSGRPSTRRPPA